MQQDMNQNLDQIFAALADPTRRAILERLTKGEASASELQEPFQMSQPAISRHLKVLTEAGLIERRVEKQTRPARLCVENLQSAKEWLGNLENFWEGNLDRMDQLLKDMKEDKGENHEWWK